MSSHTRIYPFFHRDVHTKDSLQNAFCSEISSFARMCAHVMCVSVSMSMPVHVHVPCVYVHVPVRVYAKLLPETWQNIIKFL